MNIRISTQGISLTPELQNHVERRLYFALGRFDHRISRVRVRLVDVNGPRGGLDTRCAVHVRLERMPPVIVDELSDDPTAAVDIAVGRAGRAVSRRIDRTLTRLRGRPNAA